MYVRNTYTDMRVCLFVCGSGSLCWYVVVFVKIKIDAYDFTLSPVEEDITGNFCHNRKLIWSNFLTSKWVVELQIL